MSCLHHSNAHWLSQGAPCQCSCHSVELECTLVLALGTNGKHVAITHLKQTVKLVLNATKHLGTVWTAVFCFVSVVFCFVFSSNPFCFCLAPLFKEV